MEGRNDNVGILSERAESRWCTLGWIQVESSLLYKVKESLQSTYQVLFWQVTTALISIYSARRQFGSADWTLHLDVHPLCQTFTVKNTEKISGTHFRLQFPSLFITLRPATRAARASITSSQTWCCLGPNTVFIFVQHVRGPNWFAFSSSFYVLVRASLISDEVLVGPPYCIHFFQHVRGPHWFASSSSFYVLVRLSVWCTSLVWQRPRDSS